MGALTSYALQAAIILTYPFIPQTDMIYIKDGKEISIEELMTIENSSITPLPRQGNHSQPPLHHHKILHPHQLTPHHPFSYPLKSRSTAALDLLRKYHLENL